MPQFKFLGIIFNRLLPSWYKENDTYTDTEGAGGIGIMERFLAICENYIDTEITPEIDNYMDNIDLENNQEIFVNYLWEYFGFIPYAYGVIIHHTPFTKIDLDRWVSENRSKPTADFRNILRFAISLYKIRCTEQFYEVLGRFYDIKIELTVVNTGGAPESGSDLVTTSYDSPSTRYDSSLYDYTRDCLQCTDILADIGIPATHNLTEDYKQAIYKILNKYLPVHINEFNSTNTTFYVI